MQSSGGTYSGDLLLDFTTHLVYKDFDLAKQGEKYATAVSWGLPMRPFAWLQDCAQCEQLLPDTYKACLIEPEAGSPATKLQQLCLREDRQPCFVAAQRLVSTPVAVQPPDTGSQVQGPHVLHGSPQRHEQMDLGEAAELLSCNGSFDPEQPQAFLTSSPGNQADDAQDADDSDTCSNRTSPEWANCEVDVVCQAADAAQAAEHPQSSSIECLTIPDSQPDDLCMDTTRQHLAGPAVSSIAEEHDILHQPSRDSGALTSILDSSSDINLTTFSTSDPPQAQKPGLHLATSLSSAAAYCHDVSADSEEQLPSSCKAQSACAEPSPDQACDIVPDTEPHASPSTVATDQDCLPVAPGTRSSYACNPSSEHVTSHGPQQAKQESAIQRNNDEQQQKQQQQQQQLVPPQSVCSSSTGSPSTSYASCAFVVEDSDSESEFQPLRPARPSTGRLTSAQQTSRSSGYKAVQPGKQGVVPVKLMSRYPRGTTVKEHHGLVSLKGVQFAEQLQVLNQNLHDHQHVHMPAGPSVVSVDLSLHTKAHKSNL